MGGGDDPDVVITALFASGEKGFNVYPGTAITKLYQEITGASATTPAGVGDYVGTVYDTVTGIYLTASNSTRRPTLQNSGDVYWLQFDGSDDCLVSPSINFGTDKASVFTAYDYDVSEARVFLEMSTNFSGVNGGILINHELSKDFYTARGNLGFVGYGLSSPDADPAAHIVNCQWDFSGNTRDTEFPVFRVDGANASRAYTNGTYNNNTANFANLPFYVGARADSTLRFNGKLYGLTVRGALTPEYGPIETYLSTKSGIAI